MSVFGTRTRYGTVAKTLHWLTAVLVAAAFVISRGGPESRVYAPQYELVRDLHETIGMLVVAVVLLRLLWRLFDRRPDKPPMPPWMTNASRAVQLALYVLLLAVPATAVAGAWYEGHAVTVYGLGDIAPMLPPAHELGVRISRIHKLLGDFVIWLAGVHAAAALFHHYVLRDGALLSMLPQRKALSARGATR